MADKSKMEDEPKMALCVVITDKPVDRVYKGGTVKLPMATAKQFEDAGLIKIVADEEAAATAIAELAKTDEEAAATVTAPAIAEAAKTTAMASGADPKINK
jgi:hypothetical protein